MRANPQAELEVAKSNIVYSIVDIWQSHALPLEYKKKA